MLDERRRHDRIAWEGDALAEVGGQLLRCRAVDLSFGGAALTFHGPLQGDHTSEGDPVALRLVVDGEGVFIRGVVAWSRGTDSPRCGVRFVSAHPSSIRRIGSFLRRRRASDRPSPIVGVPEPIESSDDALVALPLPLAAG